MWDWSSEAFRTGEVGNHAELASFASGLVVNGPGGLDVSKSILSRYRMRALPLVEWNLSADAPLLFGVLRSAGATRGYFIDYPGHDESVGQFHECDLSPDTAAVIEKDDLFGWSTVFVDDRFLCVIAAWFTDFTYLCMSPGLFDTYLATNPMFLDLYGCNTEVPAERFQAALHGALSRLDQWSPSTSAVRSALERQLIRPASSNGS